MSNLFRALTKLQIDCIPMGFTLELSYRYETPDGD